MQKPPRAVSEASDRPFWLTSPRPSAFFSKHDLRKKKVASPSEASHLPFWIRGENVIL